MNCANCQYLELIPSNLFIKPYPYCNFHDMDLIEGPNEVNPDYHVCDHFQGGDDD